MNKCQIEVILRTWQLSCVKRNLSKSMLACISTYIYSLHMCLCVCVCVYLQRIFRHLIKFRKQFNAINATKQWFDVLLLGTLESSRCINSVIAGTHPIYILNRNGRGSLKPCKDSAQELMRTLGCGRGRCSGTNNSVRSPLMTPKLSGKCAGESRSRLNLKHVMLSHRR